MLYKTQLSFTEVPHAVPGPTGNWGSQKWKFKICFFLFLKNVYDIFLFLFELNNYIQLQL